MKIRGCLLIGFLVCLSSEVRSFAAEAPAPAAKPGASAKAPGPRAAAAVSPLAWVCDNATATSVAEIPQGNVAGCVEFRKDHSVTARVLTNPSRFATVCPVTLEKPVFDLKCGSKALLSADDKIQISQFGKDDYRLTIWHHVGGDLQASNLLLTAGKAAQGIGWLEGHETTQGHDYSYYVYFDNKLSAGGDLVKYYRLEIFEDGKCSEQTPTNTFQDDPQCNLAPAALRAGSHQSNTGGGGEPPPIKK